MPLKEYRLNIQRMKCKQWLKLPRMLAERKGLLALKLGKPWILTALKESFAMNQRLPGNGSVFGCKRKGLGVKGQKMNGKWKPRRSSCSERCREGFAGPEPRAGGGSLQPLLGAFPRLWALQELQLSWVGIAGMRAGNPHTQNSSLTSLLRSISLSER